MSLKLNVDCLQCGQTQCDCKSDSRSGSRTAKGSGTCKTRSLPSVGLTTDPATITKGSVIPKLHLKSTTSAHHGAGSRRSHNANSSATGRSSSSSKGEGDRGRRKSVSLPFLSPRDIYLDDSHDAYHNVTNGRTVASPRGNWTGGPLDSPRIRKKKSDRRRRGNRTPHRDGDEPDDSVDEAYSGDTSARSARGDQSARSGGGLSARSRGDYSSRSRGEPDSARGGRPLRRGKSKEFAGDEVDMLGPTNGTGDGSAIDSLLQNMDERRRRPDGEVVPGSKFVRNGGTVARSRAVRSDSGGKGPSAELAEALDDDVTSDAQTILELESMRRQLAGDKPRRSRLETGKSPAAQRRRRKHKAHEHNELAFLTDSDDEPSGARVAGSAISMTELSSATLDALGMAHAAHDDRNSSPRAVSPRGASTGGVISEVNFVRKEDSSAAAAAQLQKRYDTFRAAELKRAVHAYDANALGVDVAHRTSKARKQVSEELKPVYVEAVQLWNNESLKAALAYLESHGVGEPEPLALFLVAEHEFLDKERLGEFFGSPKELSVATFRCFLRHLHFKRASLLPALRSMIGTFRLPGEGQVIDRIMRTFSEVYSEANEGQWKDADNVHTLAVLVLTLNTSEHNPNEERKISKEDWVYFCEEITEKEPMANVAFLEDVWEDIQAHEIRMPMEGLFPDMVRRGFLERLEPGIIGQKWVSRWCVLSDRCIYLFAAPDDDVPRAIIPLTGVRSTRLSAATSGPSRPHIFDIRSSEPDAPLVYTEKDKSSGALRQGKEKVLSFNARSRDERDWWVDDINGNMVTQASLLPIVVEHDAAHRGRERVRERRKPGREAREAREARVRSPRT